MKENSMSRKELVERFIEGDNKFYDGNDDNIKTYYAIVELAGEHKLTCFIEGTRHQCFNPLSLNRKLDMAYLSSYSIGGTIEGETLTKYDIKKYNDSILSKSKKIKKVIFQSGKVWDVDPNTSNVVETVWDGHI